VKILSAVYNPIAYDGRVQRACEALSEIADLELVCPQGPQVPGLPFKVTTVCLPHGLGRQIRQHIRFMQAFVRRARQTRPDVIHAHDYFLAAPGVVAAAASGAALVYDAHELIIHGERKRFGSRASLWYRLERWAIAYADLVIAANDDRSRLMCEHYGLRTQPLVVRNIPPVPKENPQRGTSILKRSAGESLCVYQGHISLKRGLARLLTAMPFIPKNIRLIIVGGGPDEELVRQEVSRLGLEGRVTIFGRVSRDELHEILQDCDIGLLMYPYEGLNNIYCAPNKIFEYAQAGLPIVATDQPPIAEMLRTYQIGETFGRYDDPAKLAARVSSAIEHRHLYRKDLGRFLADNTWSDQADSLQRAVLQVAAEHRAAQ